MISDHELNFKHLRWAELVVLEREKTHLLRVPTQLFDGSGFGGRVVSSHRLCWKPAFCGHSDKAGGNLDRMTRRFRWA
jgi:hypothetical protein